MGCGAAGAYGSRDAWVVGGCGLVGVGRLEMVGCAFLQPGRSCCLACVSAVGGRGQVMFAGARACEVGNA